MAYGTAAGALRRQEEVLAPAGLRRGWESGRLGNRGTLMIAGLLAALFLGTVAILTADAPQLRVPTLATAPAASTPTPADMAASRGVGLDQHAYWVTRSADRLLAVNAGQRMRATFTAGGVRVGVPGGAVTLSLRAFGRGRSLESEVPVAPVSHANRVSYRRAGLVEWYANGPFGLEQGVKLSSRPAGAESSGVVKLAFALRGGGARLRAGQLTLAGAGSATILRYGGLIATDALGRVLPSGLLLDGHRLLIEVNDRGARYPITIDPLIQAATLTASDSAQKYWFGFRTAVSGSTLVVGDPTADGGEGAAYVFTEPASGWANATQAAILNGPGGATTDSLGYSVAASGTTVFAGAPYAGQTSTSQGQGAVYAYTEPTSGWPATMTPTATLTDSANATGVLPDYTGWSVAATGSTVFAGAPYAGALSEGVGSFGTGQVLVFNEQPGGWISETQSATLSPSDGGPDQLGQYLAVSGSTLAAGAPDASNGAGAVYVFQAPWTTGTQTAVLTAPGQPAGQLGYKVATDGSTIVAGAPFATVGSITRAGSVFVYTEPSSGGWVDSAAPAAELTPSTTTSDALFGLRLAIGPFPANATNSSASASQSAETVFVGTGNGTGVYAFAKPASGWQTASAPALLGLASASTYSLTLGGNNLFEGVDNSTGEFTATPTYHPGSVNVFGTPGGGGGTGTPVDTAPPVVSGSAKAGGKLSCSTGTWTNDPTKFSYQWYLNGTPIQGATGSTYKVQSGDEQLTLTCSVTASNGKGAGSPATVKRGKTVPVPHVTGCPKATGGLSGETLGLVKLGDTRAQAAKAYTHSSNRGKQYEDFFCLTPIGVRVGFASPALLHTLPKSEQGKLSGRVIWASTSSAYYTIDGIRVGATVAAAALKLKLTGPIHVGLNDWYIAPNGSSTAVLKVRHGVIEEIGIGDKSLTGTHAEQLNFFKSFS